MTVIGLDDIIYIKTINWFFGSFIDILYKEKRLKIY